MPPRFTCPVCRSLEFEQVVVRLASGMLRQTDFFCCRGCRTVFFDRTAYHAGEPAGVIPRAPDPKTYSG